MPHGGSLSSVFRPIRVFVDKYLVSLSRRLLMIKLFILISLISSCSILDHRSFEDEMEHETEGAFIAGEDFDIIAGDTGRAYRTTEEILERTPMSESQKYTLNEDRILAEELAEKESSLDEDEISSYVNAEPFLKNSSEKMYYLGLANNERAEYLSSKQDNSESIRANTSMISPQIIPNNRKKVGRGIASMDPAGYSDNSIAKGMTKDEVIRNWGRPSNINYAGDASQQNERWFYFRNGSKRYVFFEAGVVDGWYLE